MEVDKENLSKLTNDELFKAMKKYGLSAGPITSTTRSVYEKKLKNFLDNQENGTSAPKTTKSNDNAPHSTPKNTATTITPIEKKEIPTESLSNTDNTSNNSKNLQPAVVLKQLNISSVNKITTNGTESSKSIEKIDAYVMKSSNGSQKSDFEIRKQTLVADKTATPDISNSKIRQSTRNEDLFKSVPLNRNLESKFTGSESARMNKPSLIDKEEKIANQLSEFRLLKSSVINEPVIMRSSDFSSLNSTMPSSSGSSDKFADRLKTYGLLKTDVLEPASELRSRSSLSSSGFSNQNKKNIYEEKKEAIPTETQSNNVKKTSQNSSTINWKYLLTVFIATLIAYFIVMHFQSNPENPVEMNS